MKPVFGQMKKAIIMGVHSHELQRASWRLSVMMFFFMLCFAGIALRLIDLTVMGQSDDVFINGRATKGSVNVQRANIVDRNGRILSTSLKTSSLSAKPQMVQNPKKMARDLVEVLPHLKYGDILQKLQSDKKFIWVKRNLTPSEKYKINALGYPSLSFSEEMHRLYPQENLTSHIVGYTDIDGQGIAGIEKSFDRLLSQGDDVMLTIDARLQHIVRRELSKTIKKFTAKGGSGIVMNVETGEVLSMVSLPDFDPNHIGDASPDDLFNRNTLGVFEMGSTFKIFSTAIALESGTSKMGDVFDTTKPLKYGRYRIRDYHAKKKKLSLVEVFIYSSNIGSALMAEKTGTKRLKGFYRDLGFLDAAQIEIPEIGRPIVSDPWGDIHTLTASYGHGIAVSPLQLARATSAIVNGGILPMPSLIKNMNDLNKEKASLRNQADMRVLSPKTSAKMRQLMEYVVIDGTGKNAGVKGYRVGGKTGTAEKASGGGYSRRKLLSSFVAVFPMDKPQYVVLIIVDEPNGIKETYGYATGGWTAAPVVANIIRQMAPLMAMKPDENDNADSIRKVMDLYIHKEKNKGKHFVSF